VALRRARSIDRLHTLVADHDLVVTADAPLALALNRRARGARLGDVATTPRNYAKQGLEVADRREMFHEVVQARDLSFKRAATYLDRVLRCWEDTGSAEAILEHDRYASEEMRAVVDIVTGIESAYSLREDVTAPESLDLAVIDADGLSALDRAVLPDAYDEVDAFADAGTFELGSVDLLPSTVSIADTLEAHITADNAGDVGVVLDPAGPVRPLVEATLEARSIPYHTEDELAEHPGLRSFLRAVRLGMTREGLRARDVRGLVAELGLPGRRRDDDKLVSQLEERRLGGLTELWDAMDGLRLGEALERFREIADAPRELTTLVDELGLGDAPLTRELLDALAFYLETYPIERDYSREGVLLASGRDNAYVDRPLVFHVGLGTGWAQTVPDEAWTTPEQRRQREARDLARFGRLLQSGRRRAYLVQDTRRGQPVTPCFHLHEILDRTFERFAELPHDRRRAPEPTATTGNGFEPDRDLVDVDPEPVETLSSSDLDQLTHCPREWFMDQLVPTTETLWLRRGRIVHAFAELAAQHTDRLDEDTIAELADVGLEAMADLVDPDERPAHRTELELAFRAIRNWLAVNPPEGAVPEGYQPPPPDRQADNLFADHLEVPLERERSERWFRSPALGVHGKVDLVHAPTRLVDWKSARNPDSLPKTVRRARVDEPEDVPRFQPSVYLLHHRSTRPTEDLEFAFVDLLAERTQAIQGGLDPREFTRRLRYTAEPFTEHVASEAAYEHATQSSNKREDVFAAVGYEAYRSYVEGAQLPDFEDKQAALAHPFTEGLIDLAKRKRGDLVKCEGAARGVVKQLVRLRERTLSAGDLDRLADHVDDVLADSATWRSSRFPVPDSVDLDDVEHRDLVLRDLSAHRDRREARHG
jgi:hypothetical protein